jgi:hypothetical protein
VRSDDQKRVEQWEEFKEWFQAHGPFDVVLDAANIGYFNQNYSGCVSFSSILLYATNSPFHPSQWRL